MAFGTRYTVEILYEPKYGRGAEITKIIEHIARGQGFADLETVKRIMPTEAGRAYPTEKQYWIHLTKAHKGVEWRNSLVGINYNILGAKIDLSISTVGEAAHDVWGAMVKDLRSNVSIKKITIKSIEQWGYGESIKDGPIVVK